MQTRGFLINHLGYEIGALKRAVFVPSPDLPTQFAVQRDDDGTVVWTGATGASSAVARWGGGAVRYAPCDFSSFDAPGTYRLSAAGTTSEPFAIGRGLLLKATGRPLFRYFRGQRCRGAYDEADRRVPFFGGRADERADVHGGWYDASGDLSKYLSHLSYANFMNPQQTPLVVYSLLAAADLAAPDAVDAQWLVELRTEAAYGGDFLVRMQDPAGYFYPTVFDVWSKKLEAREICSYRTQRGEKLARWAAGYRQGGGLAVAALARLAASGVQHELTSERYLETARLGFEHLEAHGLEYLDDGRENVIDDYCALLAAVELFAATHDASYRKAAQRRADALIGRLSRDSRYTDFWRADDGERPFFHASDAGLPAVALLRAAETGAVERAAAHDAVRRSLRFECAITDEVANPFGYPRQYVQPASGPPRGAFFFPHENESGYWWQGENARLASLSTAAALAVVALDLPAGERERLRRYASDPLDWIFGRNPFDSCMMFGYGRRNEDYLAGWPNYPGGVCNGITSGFHDEDDIAFAPAPQVDDPTQNWRWGEQWLPHGAWLLFALAARTRL